MTSENYYSVIYSRSIYHSSSYFLLQNNVDISSHFQSITSDEILSSRKPIFDIDTFGKYLRRKERAGGGNGMKMKITIFELISLRLVTDDDNDYCFTFTFPPMKSYLLLKIIDRK